MKCEYEKGGRRKGGGEGESLLFRAIWELREEREEGGRSARVFWFGLKFGTWMRGKEGWERAHLTFEHSLKEWGRRGTELSERFWWERARY